MCGWREVPVRTNLAEALARTGDTDGAIAQLVAATSAPRGCREPRAFSNLGLLLSQVGRAAPSFIFGCSVVMSSDIITLEPPTTRAAALAGRSRGVVIHLRLFGDGGDAWHPPPPVRMMPSSEYIVTTLEPPTTDSGDCCCCSRRGVRVCVRLLCVARDVTRDITIIGGWPSNELNSSHTHARTHTRARARARTQHNTHAHTRRG